MKARSSEPPVNEHVRVFYRFEEYKILDNRFFFEVTYCPGIRDFWGDGMYGDEWNITLNKWNSSLAHWQYTKEFDSTWKRIFKVHPLRSVRVQKEGKVVYMRVKK